MCGILCYIYKDKNITEEQLEDLEKLLRRRGPDACTKLCIELECGWTAVFIASTLWTQGSEPRVQPLQDEKGILLWNGDVYSGLINESSCDTDNVFQALSTSIEKLNTICGPYAFIFYDKVRKILSFGRDVIGRHSLLWHHSKSHIIITSVGLSSIEFEEIPSYGLFNLDLECSSLDLKLYPWSHLKTDIYQDLNVNIKEKIEHCVLKKCTDYKWLTPKLFQNQINLDLLLKDPEINACVKKLTNLLLNSVKKRVKAPNYCKNCIKERLNCDHAKISVCFSGGLDSTLLALVADLYVPKNEAIDLFNVSFENSGSYQAPDRISGLKSYEELKKLAPRKWNFVEINVSKNELSEMRHKCIKNLIHPLNTILDDSLGSALWFASRGNGLVDNENYLSPTRIILLGMGADELFGGYSRHRKEFFNSSWKGLGEKLLEEIRNIGRRNLGRDNRIVSDHQRQPRMPYLDEEFLAFVDSLPPWDRSYPSGHQAGVGDKYLLRLVAWEMGLRFAATLPKKAMQFGTKIANSKEKGHHVSTNLNKK